MKYCTKCGSQLNDSDVFCPKCGTKSVVENKQEDIYSNNYADKEEYKSNTVGKIAFILSIVGLVLFNGLMFMIGFGDYIFPALTGASLGTAIPGFVISRRRKANKRIAIAGFVLALILVTCMIVLYGLLPNE